MSRQVVKATINDVPQMHKLINYFADKHLMLGRPLSILYEDIRNFIVVKEGDEVLGCVALGICWADLAEVKSLAVKEGYQRQGIGADLVKACIEEAKALNIIEVFCLTYQDDFFKVMGFDYISKDKLPRKVWGECYLCPKYPDCDEIAMVYKVIDR